MRENEKIGVIILAAGSSSRLGYPKQLVEFRGIPLLQQSMEVAKSLKFEAKILVLGANAEEIEKAIDIRNFEVVYNKDWEEGMGTSIAKGTSEALQIEEELDHILMLVSDQPFVSKEKIQELMRVQLDSNKPATFSKYAGEVGVPAIFSKEIFPELQELKKGQGAKKLILNNEISFETVKFEGGNFDVDTAEDVELLKRMEE